MKRIHTLKRTIALFLAMLMAATSTAFADWDSFQGNNDNNGVTEVNITGATAQPSITLPNNGASTGVDVEPLVHGSRIYALYNGGTPMADGTGGARLAAVDASNSSLIWTVPVDMKTGDTSPAEDIMTKRANNVSQIATPVITSDGTTLYGTYTYTQDMMSGKTVAFSGDYSDGKIGANGTAIATISGVTLPGGYGNLQVGTDITSTGTDQQIGTVSIKNGESVVQSFTSNSYGTYNFNIYYSDGTPVPGGTYTIEVSVENTTDTPIPWSTVSLLVNRWGLFKVDGIDGSSPATTLLNPSGTAYTGQASTPLTISGNYVYFGIYDGDRAYFQYDISDGTLAKFAPPGNDQFYWAGAVVKDGRVYFGSEQGVVYVCSEGTFTIPLGNMYITGGAHIRSSMVLKHHKIDSLFDGNVLYFTSQDGKLWRVQVQGDSVVRPEYVSLGSGVTSVSTPTIVSTGDNCNIYVGYSDANYGANNGIKVVTSANFTTGAAKDVCKADGQVQSSPVVYRNSSGTDYIYFTTNTWNGTGYCCKYDGSAGSQVWTLAGVSAYCLQGFAMGTYQSGRYEYPFGVFGNDGSADSTTGNLTNQLIIVKTNA